ncbi:MAG: hypothetical protein OXI16_09140 [Chloroflexota bacterium]|nr:hypothetical protein [Chloroflexota bacterium]
MNRSPLFPTQAAQFGFQLRYAGFGGVGAGFGLGCLVGLVA